MLKLKVQYFGHLMRRADSWEKTLMLGKTEGRRRRAGVGCHYQAWGLPPLGNPKMPLSACFHTLSSLPPPSKTRTHIEGLKAQAGGCLLYRGWTLLTLPSFVRLSLDLVPT